MSFVIFLKTGHYAQIRLALWTMIFRLPPQYPPVGVDGIPAIITPQGRSWPYNWTVTGSSTTLEKN